MLKKVLLAVGAALASLSIAIALQPATFHVERSMTTLAPPSVVRAQVDDFRAWQAWSPWEKLDPALKRDFQGARALAPNTRGPATTKSAKGA